MAFEETARDPLVDGDSDHLNEVGHADIQIIRLISPLNSFEEEILE